ncbi:MAG: MlaD family protein [Bacteroidota bacterium]
MLFTIAERSFFLRNTFVVKAEYSRVAGLIQGASVQYQGVNVGRVESVQLPGRPGDKIVVEMAIRQAARPLLNPSTQAQIKSEGLVGNQIVVLVNPPQATSEDIAEGAFIRGVDPFDLFEITDRALVSVQQFENAAISFKEIVDDVRSGQGTLGRLVYDPTLYDEFVATTSETRRVLGNVADNAEALVGLAGEATQGVQSIINKVDRGEGTLAQLINNPAVYNQLLATSDTLLAISRDLRAITVNAENAANWGALGAFRFAELMEAAKHNWLFKRYFEERGNMELASFEQRERAIRNALTLIEAKQRELYEREQALNAREAQSNVVTPPSGGPGTGSDQ